MDYPLPGYSKIPVKSQGKVERLTTKLGKHRVEGSGVKGLGSARAPRHPSQDFGFRVLSVQGSRSLYMHDFVWA